MPTKTRNRESRDELVSELLLLAQTAIVDERRTEKRFPFFRAVSVEINGHTFSALTREIGASGIGLLHSMKLPLEEGTVTVAGRHQHLRLRIERCESIGAGWYISGGRFVGTSTS